MWINYLNRELGHVDVAGTGIEVLHWAYASHLPGNVPHRHTYYEACLVGQYGSGNFFTTNGVISLRPLSFFLARPGEIHQILNTGQIDMELYWVSFALRGSKELSGSLGQAFARSQTVLARDQEPLWLLWRALREACPAEKQNQIVNFHLVEYLGQALFCSLLMAACDPDIGVADASPPFKETASAQNDMLGRLAVRYIQDNLERPLTTDEIAHHVGVSRRQLSRIIGSFTGTGPAAYIRRARIDRAQGLLRHGKCSIKEVARVVGFTEVAHFTRVFTQLTGSPPGVFQLKWSNQNGELGKALFEPGALV